MTSNKEDYLKAIYHLSEENGRASTQDIARRLGVAPASVSEMLSRLTQEGLLNYEPYKGSALTEKGRQTCEAIIRVHELWEVFLVNYLDYSWSEAHEEADRLEHASSQRLAERLDLFLQQPEYCPHGALIPRPEYDDPGSRPASLTRLRLIQMQPGQTARILQVEEEPALLDYLQARGIRIGAVVRLEAVEAYEGPLTLRLDGGRQLQISQKAAGQIWVSPLTT
ncbi:metal-dependent transcriptional regulator [Oscillospiraceae bacterium HV4-5-C5C]|nr:metal-dependent transcriptional regulator [Oscillospiraceae bacterium HV4-5-C5C]